MKHAFTSRGNEGKVDDFEETDGGQPDEISIVEPPLRSS